MGFFVCKEEIRGLIMFDEKFVRDLPEDPNLAGKEICDKLEDLVVESIRNSSQEKYEQVLTGMGLLQAFVEGFNFPIHFPKLDGEIANNIRIIRNFLLEIRPLLERAYINGQSNKFKEIIQKKYPEEFFYKFTEGDLKRIQSLIDELRTIISETKGLEDDHKSRLLGRLESLQSELHKSVSDLDKFWGLLIDASIVLRKVGENAKPIVDRVREIVDIIWRVQIRAEELPSNTPLELPSITESSKEGKPRSEEE